MLLLSNGAPFSTSDRDNDIEPTVSCVAIRGSPSWFNDCGFFNPFGAIKDTSPQAASYPSWPGGFPLHSIEWKIRKRRCVEWLPGSRACQKCRTGFYVCTTDS